MFIFNKSIINHKKIIYIPYNNYALNYKIFTKMIMKYALIVILETGLEIFKMDPFEEDLNINIQNKIIDKINLIPFKKDK
jgi:hypothetical protein